MNPFVILLVGMAVVVGGILFFRLHAFLALALAALAVGLLTPTDAVLTFERGQSAGEVVVPDDASAGQLVYFTLKTPSGKKQVAEAGMIFLVFGQQTTDASAAPLARLKVLHVEERSVNDRTQELAVAVVIDHSPDKRKQTDSPSTPKSGDRVISPAAWQAARKTADKTAIERIADGFGATCAKIGILIAMASIIGKCLLESGAAHRIIRSLLGLLGEARASLAFMIGGFTLGIPVFFDTVFYLMIPLGKALRMQTGRNYLLYILTITAGASMAHSLVPPTPGPLLVASELGVNLGLMILGGCYVGVFCSAFGYFYAHWINRRMEIPLRDSPDAPLDKLKEMSQRKDSELPPLWLSLAPILLPVLLIAGGTILDPKTTGGVLSPMMADVVRFLSNKNIALILAAAIALVMLIRHKRTSREEVATGVSAALASAGVIILITAIGGAFGGMLKQTGIGDAIARMTPSAYPLLVLPLAFFVTTMVRTAQGSATVAMITAVGILAPLASATDLGYHNVYLALAIGCGSKPIAWMNDSGFWVICKMSGMTEAETLKSLTPMTACMGLVGLAVTVVTAWLVPLV